MARNEGYDIESLTGLQPIHLGSHVTDRHMTSLNEEDVTLPAASVFHCTPISQPSCAHSVSPEPGPCRSPDFSNVTMLHGMLPSNDPPSCMQQNRQIQYKLTPPKPYTMGDNFRTFRLILMNYMKDAHQLEEQQTIFLSLIQSTSPKSDLPNSDFQLSRIKLSSPIFPLLH